MKVFISHSSSDKKFVRTLKSDLNENGIDTFVDEDSLEFGDSLKERLEVAIDESSHFIIILSPNATNSEWVKFELKEALSLFDKKTLAKIIPINYRRCEIPKELENMLYVDLSEEIVQIKDDRVKFLTGGYENLLPRLIKTLHASDKRLNKGDRTEIKKEAKESEKLVHESKKSSFTTKHKVIKYKDTATVAFYTNKVLSNLRTKPIGKLLPIMLPTIYRAIFTELQLGSKILFTIDNSKKYIGYFAGYRTGEGGIAMSAEMRKVLNVESGLEYNFSVDSKTMTFHKL